MIQFSSGGALLETPEDLERCQVPRRIETLYADFETSSGDPSLKSLNPWRHCGAIGAAVSFGPGEDDPVWFVPKRLMQLGAALGPGHSWWERVLTATKEGRGHWVNHNVKYDMHVSANDLGIRPECDVEDTVTSAKLVDSDRQNCGGYGLDALSLDWLGWDISRFENAFSAYVGPRQKDYGRIPVDLLAEYACVDVQAEKRLHAYLRERMPEESMDCFRTERRFTYKLFKIEQTGVRVDPTDLKIKHCRVLYRMLELDDELCRIVGRNFRAHVNEDCYDVLVNQFGLPVLEWTQPGDEDEETGEVAQQGGPSFNKAALRKYLVHPRAPEGLVERIIEYRTLNTFNSLFLNKWEDLNIDGVLHSTYNQVVRTGRLSCSGPNMQQLSLMAKELIIPPPGFGIVSADLSQIEFRVIVHYLENRRCLEAFRRNPWTDFHVWVANSVPTERKPAKTLNFMLGYGGGMKKTVATLSVNKDLVGEIIAAVESDQNIPDDQKAQAMVAACERRAKKVYDGYHALLPELKPTTRQATSACQRKGYVRNHYGRRRHLPADIAWKAFNNVCQGTAGDLFKDITVELDDQMPEFQQTALVHDQVVGLLPLETLRAEAWHGDASLRRITNIMNTPSRPLRVPIRTSIGWSDRSWAEAQSDACEQKF